MSNVEQHIAEILDRLIRTESRIVQLGDHVGANLRSKQKIEIVRTDLTTPVPAYVRIDSLDVSVSRILTELRQANLHARSVDVFIGDALVCTLFPTIPKG